MTNEEQHQGGEGRREEGFQSDTQKLMQKHLSDPDHEITDEDLAQVRVGMSPGPGSPTQQAVQDSDERIADSKKLDEDEGLPGAQRITPWDLTS